MVSLVSVRKSWLWIHVGIALSCAGDSPINFTYYSKRSPILLSFYNQATVVLRVFSKNMVNFFISGDWQENWGWLLKGLVLKKLWGCDCEEVTNRKSNHLWNDDRADILKVSFSTQQIERTNDQNVNFVHIFLQCVPILFLREKGTAVNKI